MNKHLTTNPEMFTQLGARLIGSELYLLGPIGESPDGDGGFNAADVINALQEHGPGDLSVKINSPGGWVFEAVAIYNEFKSHSGMITVEVVGLAASAASLIAMAGDEIVMHEGALMMIHDPQGITWGNEHAHRRSADQLKKIADQAVSIYARRTGNDEEAVREWMAAETWFDGDEAVEAGFADHVISPESDRAGATMRNIQAAMSVSGFDYHKFHNIPETARQPALRVGDNGGSNKRGFSMNAHTQPKMRAKEMRKHLTPLAEQRGLGADIVEMAIREAGGDPQAARDVLLQAFANGQPGPVNNHKDMSAVSTDSRDIIEALSMRLGSATAKPADAVANMSMVELMRMSLIAEGISANSASDRQVMMMAMEDRRPFRSRNPMMSGGQHTRSDFPALLVEAGQRTLLERFSAEESVLKKLSKLRYAKDYRPTKMIRPGEAPKLQRRVESGEIKRGTMETENAGQFAIEQFAVIFALSHEALVNDDLGAFSDFLSEMADSAARTEREEFFNVLSANSFGGALMGDGTPLFHADHGNLADAGGALSVAALSTARETMRLQKNVNKDSTSGVAPAVLVVGPKLETTAEQIVAALTPSQVDQVNPFGGKLRVEVESQYDGNGWWLFADPVRRPAFVHGYLDSGPIGPEVAMRDGWEVRGVEFRCTLDFGCGPFDHRAAYFNPGA